MENAYSNDMVQMMDVNLSLDMPNNDSNNANENFSNKNNKDNNGKKYDAWKKMKIITYILFFSNIFYTILNCIYLAFTFNDENALYWIFFIVFLGVFEIFYIMISFVMFCSEDKFFFLGIYEGFIIVFVPIIFWLSLNSLSKKFTIIFQVFAISGSSLILLFSIIFIICACKFIYCNKHIKVEYIEFKV